MQNRHHGGGHGGHGGLQHSKSGGNLLRGGSNLETHRNRNLGGESPPKVHFSDDKENDPELKVVN